MTTEHQRSLRDAILGQPPPYGIESTHNFRQRTSRDRSYPAGVRRGKEETAIRKSELTQLLIVAIYGRRPPSGKLRFECRRFFLAAQQSLNAFQSSVRVSFAQPRSQGCIEPIKMQDEERPRLQHTLARIGHREK